MAGFKTHITVSSLLGAGYAGAAYVHYGVPLPTCLLAGGLCGVSGMLPDLDSDSGAPLRESMAFAAAVVPMLLIHRFQAFGLSHESMILAGAAAYLLLRFGLTELLKRFTVHRGMFHSLPAAAIAGELGFLIASGEDVRLRLFKAGAVVIGYVSHLLLDELYSLEWYHGRLRLKHSFGTALKLFGHEWWPNVSTFAKLAILTYLVLREPNWMQRYYQPDAGRSPRQTATQLLEVMRR
jgi:membrane-bound metal-dependent hydrolase YbcI (DUF457 family)